MYMLINMYGGETPVSPDLYPHDLHPPFFSV